MSKLTFFIQKIQRDRTTCTELFNHSDNNLIGIWDRAIRASLSRVELDKSEQTKSNYWFEFKYDKDSETFKDIVYEANFSEEDTALFRTMLKTAIKHNLLIDVSEEPEIKELNIEHAYCFKEVWETMKKYLKINYGQRLGGQMAQASEEDQKLVDTAKKTLLSCYSPKNREIILRFLTETPPSSLSNLPNTRGAVCELFQQWAKDLSIKIIQ